MTESNKIAIYKYLNGELTLSQFEEFVYAEKSLEEELDEDNYMYLISFNYKDKNATDSLKEFIYDRLVCEAEFETWRLSSLLNQFIETEVDIDKKLDKFYSMFYGTCNRRGEMVKGYRFLGNLGLNYFYWMDEGYLSTFYSGGLQVELKKAKGDFKFYHSQLKPIAQKILRAIESNDIEIKKFGEYFITDDLKADLESDQIFKLKHKIK